LNTKNKQNKSTQKKKTKQEYVNWSKRAAVEAACPFAGQERGIGANPHAKEGRAEYQSSHQRR
jgi:hypothetical protein